MKKKIAVLGSTGSIGLTTLKIINNDKKNFDIILLTANTNYKKLFNQAKKFNCKNLIIYNKEKYLESLKFNKNNNLKIFHKTKDFLINFKKKIDFTMSAITGIDGLEPTLDLIKFSNYIAIANKESIICGWNLIEKKLKKYKTNFIPVDSEHFSIWTLIKNYRSSEIKKVFITASGGPFLDLPLSNFKKIKIKDAIKHPNWNMGKKISIDSASMMNKVFEVIEAQRIFNIPISKFQILIHPSSYVHAIVCFKNGISKVLIHEPDMKIPIYNALYNNGNNKNLTTKDIDFTKINNLDFSKVNKLKFPSVNIIKKIPKNISLFETVIVSANDSLVELFLQKKIEFLDIYKYLKIFSELHEFKRMKHIKPKNISEIRKVNEYVRLKIQTLSVVSRPNE